MENKLISGLMRQNEDSAPSTPQETMSFPRENPPASADAVASQPLDLSPATTVCEVVGGREVKGTAGGRAEESNGVSGVVVGDEFGVLVDGIREKLDADDRKSELKIQKRDIDILRSLEIWGALGLGQIQVLHWKKGDPARWVPLFFNQEVSYPGPAHQRLSKLAAHGWIQVFKFAHTKQLYGLSEKGHKWLQDNGRARLKTVSEVFSMDAIEHRMEAAGVGLMMREFLKLPVLTERQARSEFRRRGYSQSRSFGVPDLIVEDGYGFKAVEIERTQKAKHEYRSKWRKYRDHKWGFDRVLYFVPSRSRVIALLKIADRHGADHVYAIDTPSFRESLGSCLFGNCKGERYKLG